MEKQQVKLTKNIQIAATCVGIFLFFIKYKEYLKSVDKNKEKFLLYGNTFYPWSKPHPVVISLTTSPIRIKHLKAVFDSINPRTYDVICLNIPGMHFSVNGIFLILFNTMLTQNSSSFIFFSQSEVSKATSS